MTEYPDEIERFAVIVEKHFDPAYLRTASTSQSIPDLIRKKQIYPIKWLLSEIDKSKLTPDELAFIQYLKERNF